MTIQLSTTVRNARLDAIETAVGTAPILRFYTGSQPANCATATSGTQLASYTLASDWAANASSGSKAFNNTPLTTTSGNTGTLGYYRLFDSSATTCHMQGSITATGGGGDLTVDTVTVASVGQTINITSWTITDGNA
jgi:hypothetical protein